jgi:predicted small lipoprotein YifL
MRRFDGLARLAVAGVLIVGLGVAGCGRKGGLDVPPSAAIPAAPAAAVPQSQQPAPTDGFLLFGKPDEPPPPEAPPANPAAARRGFFLDWLLN